MSPITNNVMQKVCFFLFFFPPPELAFFVKKQDIITGKHTEPCSQPTNGCRIFQNSLLDGLCKLVKYVKLKLIFQFPFFPELAIPTTLHTVSNYTLMSLCACEIY